ncbi:MAG: hypothetical protein ACR2GP_15750 [Burkholderiaceae bacterium]
MLPDIEIARSTPANPGLPIIRHRISKATRVPQAAIMQASNGALPSSIS